MRDESRPPEPWVGTNNGRGDYGRFAKGNRLATGNPLAKRHAEIAKAIHDATSIEDVVDIWQGVIRDAKDGDEGARKIFFDRVLGRPSQAIELTGMDGDPVKVDMANLTATLLVALKAFPEAKIAVAGALRQLSLNKAQGGDDGPETGTAIQLDPAMLMLEVGMTPDPWQVNALRSEARRLLILCARQLGKSTVAALIALAAALFQAGALVLITSRTERQSLELLKKVTGFFHKLGDPVPATRELESCLELANGSRIVALPGMPDNLRGFSAPAMILVDEAGWVPDDLFTAILPMVATSGGRIVVLSTPSGRLGFFAAQANGEDDDWERITAKASECPRITSKFLEGERTRLGERNYTQEYECAFLGQGGAVFRRITDAIDRGRTETSIVTDPRLSFGIGVDIGRHNDATIITIVDSNGVQHYWERITECSYPRQIEAIKHSVTVLQELADKHRQEGSSPVKLQEAAICIDATGIGDPIYDALIYDGFWVVPYTLTNLSKKGLIDRLAAAFDNGKIRLMDIEVQEQELLAFEVQKTPTGLERMGAPPGQHDDCVISCACVPRGEQLLG